MSVSAHARHVLEIALADPGVASEILTILNETADDTSTGTNASTWTVDADSTKPKLAMASQTGGTGNYTTTMKPESTLSADNTIIVPEANGDTLVAVGLAQTLTNKTLTAPVIQAISMTGTTGNQSITLTANLADALSLVNGAVGDILVVKTTTDAVELDVAKEVVLQCGAFAGSYATGSATVFTSAKTAVGRFYGESTSDLTSAVNARTIVGRHLIVTASGTVNHETYGIIGQVCVKNTTLGHLHAGVMGTFEVSTAATINGSYTYGAAGVIARLGTGTSILTATKAVCGFSAFLDGEALASGNAFAYGVDAVGATNWNAALALNKCDNLLYAATGTSYESGVKIGSMTDLGGVTHACAGLARVKVGSTLYYIPLYAADQVTGE